VRCPLRVAGGRGRSGRVAADASRNRTASAFSHRQRRLVDGGSEARGSSVAPSPAATRSFSGLAVAGTPMPGRSDCIRPGIPNSRVGVIRSRRQIVYAA
jgi:hypothetical protein